jgi:hypothetical protein
MSTLTEMREKLDNELYSNFEKFWETSGVLMIKAIEVAYRQGYVDGRYALAKYIGAPNENGSRDIPPDQL